MTKPLLLAIVLLTACSSATRMPTPDLKPTAPPRAGRESWTSDRDAFAVGDVILVQVDEFTLAESNTQNRAADSRSQNMSLQLSAALKDKNLGGANADFGSGKSGESARTGTATRRNRFTSALSARVIGFGPTGQLYVKGQKAVTIDGHEQAVQLSGWVRPADVSADNIVLSSRIGDAQLSYASSGNIDRPQASLVSRVFGALWP